MALTTSAVHGDAALGGVTCGAALRSAQREPCTATRLWGGGRHPRGGTSLGKSVLACECGCVLVSWAHGTVPT